MMTPTLIDTVDITVSGFSGMRWNYQSRHGRRKCSSPQASDFVCLGSRRSECGQRRSRRVCAGGSMLVPDQVGFDCSSHLSIRHGQAPVGADAAAPAQGSEPMPGLVEGVDTRALAWFADAAVSCRASLSPSASMACSVAPAWLRDAGVASADCICNTSRALLITIDRRRLGHGSCIQSGTSNSRPKHCSCCRQEAEQRLAAAAAGGEQAPGPDAIPLGPPDTAARSEHGACAAGRAADEATPRAAVRLDPALDKLLLATVR